VLTEIDHVAIAVRDLDAAVEWYRAVFGAELAHRERVDRDGVEEALLRVAESYVQLLTPVRPESTVARFLDRRGEGVHHLAFRVDDCAAALEAAVAGGATAIDPVPRPGGRGTTVAFLHPAGAFGTLIELVEESRPS
jgi:methylmalonyl-CoA/ethylmalonyl-CoA epimerase